MIMAMTMTVNRNHPLQLPQNNSNFQENTKDYEPDREEDTLSLSDLIPTEKDDSAADGYESLEISQNMFEFLISPDHEVEKVTTPTFSQANSPENSRLLWKQASLDSQSSKSKSVKRSRSKSEYYSMFQKLKSTSFSPSKSKKVTKNSSDQEQKVSVLTSPLKSKWFLVLMGLPPKFPSDAVEFKIDVRNRLSRHAPSTFFPPHSRSEEVAAAAAAAMMADDGRRSSENRKNRSCTSCFGSGQQVQK